MIAIARFPRLWEMSNRVGTTLTSVPCISHCIKAPSSQSSVNAEIRHDTFQFWRAFLSMSVNGMLSRARARELCQQEVDLDALPKHLQAQVLPLILEHLSRPDWTKAELLRMLFLTPGLAAIKELTNSQLASFLRCSQNNVSKVIRALSNAQSPTVEIPQGRPGILSPAAEEQVKAWLAQRLETQNWPTLSAFKECVFRHLETENPTFVPQNQFYYDLLARISNDDVTLRRATSLDPSRYEVTPEMILNHFQTLQDIQLDTIDPRLVINIDETGFGQSKSGRSRLQKVIVPKSFVGTPVYREEEEKRYVSCIASTTLSGMLLTPGLICSRQQEAADAVRCYFYADCVRYHSTTAFVSREIFFNYMRTVIIPYIEQVRSVIGKDKQCLIMFDGHKGHFGELLNAFCAQHGIVLVVLPPHSSHLLQPLDRVIFRRMKREYGMMSQIPGLTKISSTLERVWNAYQATNVKWFIWRSWEAAGIVPCIHEGVCVSCSLDIDLVLQDPTLQHEIRVSEHSRGRRVDTGQTGFLNEDEFLLFEAGLCPYCCSPINGTSSARHAENTETRDRDHLVAGPIEE